MPVVLQAVLAAFPLAWFVGVIVARIVAGPEFGVLPAMTIPIVLVGALIFSLVPIALPKTRRDIMVGAAAVSFAGMWLFV